MTSAFVNIIAAKGPAGAHRDGRVDWQSNARLPKMASGLRTASYVVRRVFELILVTLMPETRARHHYIRGMSQSTAHLFEKELSVQLVSALMLHVGKASALA